VLHSHFTWSHFPEQVKGQSNIFFLLDTGTRAQEVCDINLEDVEVNSGKAIILRRYLAQTTEDISIAHAKGSPVENYSWS
jgi:hypothetical protein